jgi:divalent metal cation (Fe/Co/Zn/Cd) transporter
MLIGESALPEEVEAVTIALNYAPIVTSVIHLRTLHVGPDELLVAAKIGVSSEVTAEQIVRGIDEAESLLRKSVPTAKYVFLEPDFQRV